MKSEDGGFVADEERSVSGLLVAPLPKSLDFGSIVSVKSAIVTHLPMRL